MPDTGRTAARYVALRSSGRALVRIAPFVRFGVFGMGVSLFLHQVQPLLNDTQFTWGERRVMGIVAFLTFGGFGLGGWVAGRLLRGAAEAIELLVDTAEAGWRTADLIELQVVPALGRIANALERPSSSPREDASKRALEKIRRATSEGRWEHAERLAAKFVREFPDAPDASLMEREIAESRWAVIDQLQGKLDEARRRNDPSAVMDVRDTLTLHLRGEALHDLDRQLVRWLVHQVQRRLRESAPLPDLLALTTRVHETFADTTEGAGLAELLVKLRKASGLCIHCGRVSSAKSEVCPTCRSQDVPLNTASSPRSKEKP